MITLEWSVAVVEVYFRGYGQWFLIDLDPKKNIINIPHKFSDEHRGYCSGIFYLPEDEENDYRRKKPLTQVKTLLLNLDHPDNRHIVSGLNQDGFNASEFYFAIDNSESDKSEPNMHIELTNLSEVTNSKDEPSNAERKSMLKLIIGMAMHSYKYDPTKERNSATGTNINSIKAALEKNGIRIDDDTIRKYLTEAKEFI